MSVKPSRNGKIVVESFNALGLWVSVVSVVHHMTIPQGVVCEDESAWLENVEHHLIGLSVGTLVTIDERHVEGDAQTGRLSDSVTNEKGNLIGDRRLFYPWTGEILLFIVNFKSIEVSSFIQTLGHA